MITDNRNLLDVLKSEQRFLELGFYDLFPRRPWRLQLVFEDSATCPNSWVYERAEDDRVPCSQCVLMELVPPDRRNAKLPCREIPLKETGETLDYYYHCGTQEELTEAVAEWLRETIQRLEKSSA